LIKYVQKWVDAKLLKNPMKKKVFHNILEDQS
jgi:intergrase/recombinase